MDLFDGEVTTLDKINPPEPRKDVQDREAVNRFMRDNPPSMAGGGMLVQPSADGSRPGYAAPRTVLTDDDKLVAEWRKQLTKKDPLKWNVFLVKKFGDKRRKTLDSRIVRKFKKRKYTLESR